MSVRGPRGGRGRGHGVGRGRGRGRGKTTVWEWESYTPGPEVYEQLWHIRKATAIVTPRLPHDCPIPNVQTRILDRRQMESGIPRNFYVVEITHLAKKHTSASSSESERIEDTGNIEIEEVDLSRILLYVSPAELERFENEQFRIEAEAEAIALRAEAEELAQRRLEKNARVPGMGRGSRMLSGLGFETQAPTRGRPRGRGRGRGRGSWRGRGSLAMSGPLRDEGLQEELVDAEPIEALHREEEEIQRIIAETESDDEDLEHDSRAQTSPGLMRSAFVANSALPVSPVAVHRRPSTSGMRQGHSEVPDIDDLDLELGDYDTKSMSSAAVQLRLEDGFEGPLVEESEEESVDEDRHRSKRRRTESTDPKHRIPTARTIPILEPRRPYTQIPLSVDQSSVQDSESESSDESIPARAPSASHHPPHTNGHDEPDVEDVVHVQQPSDASMNNQRDNDEDNDDGAEEYVVETIIEHFRDDDGKKYYLVKWEGYEDSHDWLPEEDLAGAAELVTEYKARIRRKKGKEKMR